jgi:hypothetical protein
VLGPNGSLYPWRAPVVFALIGGGLLASGHYVAGSIFGAVAIVVRWLHQVGIDRGDYPP